jgi:hypothetical protein
MNREVGRKRTKGRVMDSFVHRIVSFENIFERTEQTNKRVAVQIHNFALTDG